MYISPKSDWVMKIYGLKMTKKTPECQTYRKGEI